MAVEFTTYEEVVPLVKGAISSNREVFIKKKIKSTSVRLAARFPNLITRWKEEVDLEESTLVDFVTAMVEESVARQVNNPDGFSSETMGPFAYSKFDSEDPLKGLFDAADLKALEEMLDEGDKQTPVIRMRPDILPGAPITYSGRYLANERIRRR